MYHLAEAKLYAERATGANGVEWAQLNAQLATAHAQIAQVEASHALVALVERLLERLPPPAETASARHVRLQKEEHNGV